ncbi:MULTISPECIES: phage tail tape measure protein [unclassified Sphingobium]|uniref:phage tail tape measure protein n=1 Tax=unclassified Sphingobium TaxID=2611147 RepID=UPI000A4BB2CE|nr:MULTISPECIES: phage tail tape measure protein [unclassified Sphingobium]
MAQFGSLYASLSLESASFMSGMKKAADESTKTSRIIQGSMNMASTAVRGLAAAVGIDMLAGLTQDALDFSDAIADMSDRTGVSTKMIQEFRYAAQMAGSDFETADAGLEKFAKTVGDAANGNDTAIKKLKEYGVTTLDVDEAVRQAADGIKKLDNPTKQMSATMDLFGKKAGTLTQTLAAGSEGLELQARAARDLGIVLDEGIIRNAGQANDQLDTMKMILSAQMAANISANAGAIAGFASGISTVTSALMKFWQQNPRVAMGIMGAMAGGIAAGQPGAAIGAVGGVLLGGKMGQAMEDSNMDIRFRQKKMHEARAAYYNAKGAGSTDIGIATFRHDTQQHLKEWQRQVGLLNQAVAASRAGHVPKGDLPEPKPEKSSSSKPSGPSAAELAQKEAERRAAYERDLYRADAELARASYIDRGNYAEGYAREREAIEKELADRKKEILEEVRTQQNQSGRYTEEEAKNLIQLEEKVALAHKDQINNEEASRIEEELLKSKEAELSDQLDMLGLSGEMAKTARERRDIELRRLELEKKREKLELEAVLSATSKASPEERATAQRRLDDLDNKYGAMSASVVKNTMGPLESYLDSLPDSATEVQESLEGIAVNGLESISSGLADAIVNAKSFGDVFENVGKQILATIAEIIIQQAFIKPIGGLLSGALSGIGMGGSSAGGDIVMGGAYNNFIGAHANGGHVSSSGWKLVGERGPELAYLSGGTKVLPYNVLSGIAGNAGGLTINVDARESQNEARTQELVMNGIIQAMPMIKTQANDYTMKQLGRSRL